MRIFWVVLIILGSILLLSFTRWGFYGHRKITKMAIYTLPKEVIEFYKSNATLVINRSIIPDQRRYVIAEEGPRHYIDLDDYDAIDSIPKYWSMAVEQYGEEFLFAHGLGPWYSYFTYQKLIQAFAHKDSEQILRVSSDLAHYIADANVPLHTTSNYNGQLSGQEGIHGFWETRLPQLFSDEYDFLVGRAEYIPDPQGKLWEAVVAANQLVDSVFLVEELATTLVGESKKYGYEDKTRSSVRVYSEKYSNEYHRIYPVVEQQMRRSVKMIGDFWYTAWVEAGQPDLSALNKVESEIDSVVLKENLVPLRQHEH